MSCGLCKVGAVAIRRVLRRRCGQEDRRLARGGFLTFCIEFNEKRREYFLQVLETECPMSDISAGGTTGRSSLIKSRHTHTHTRPSNHKTSCHFQTSNLSLRTVEFSSFLDPT